MHADVTLTLVVTDKGVTVVDGEDLDEIAEVVTNAVRWGGATRAEVKAYTFSVPLLGGVPSSGIEPSNVQDVTSPDLREIISKAAKRYASQNPTFDAYAALMDAVAPGTYQVEKSPGMVGIRRVDK